MTRRERMLRMAVTAHVVASCAWLDEQVTSGRLKFMTLADGRLAHWVVTAEGKQR